MSKQLSTEQACARLGIKPQTLYAYVSRGVIARSLGEDGRSRFLAADVEALAMRGRPRAGTRPVGAIEVSLVSAVTQLAESGLRYRGMAVTELCRQASFEQVCELLWTQRLPAAARFEVPAGWTAVLAGVASSVPSGAPPAERFAALTAVLACHGPVGVCSAEGVAVTGRALLSALARALPLLGRPPAQREASIAGQLWPRLTARRRSPVSVRVLEQALILLADHELATSTLAARVAASTRASPLAVVLAGLSAVSGPLHGRAAVQVHELLLLAEAASSPRAVIERHTGGDQRPIGGFGHPVYTDGDPRAAALLSVLREELPERRAALLEEFREVAVSASGARENVDFALGALAYCYDMPLGMTLAIFSLARVAGWLAHAAEEYEERPLRFRARALYERGPWHSKETRASG